MVFVVIRWGYPALMRRQAVSQEARSRLSVETDKRSLSIIGLTSDSLVLSSGQSVSVGGMYNGFRVVTFAGGGLGLSRLDRYYRLSYSGGRVVASLAIGHSRSGDGVRGTDTFSSVGG